MAGDEEVEAALKATEDITPWRVNRRCYIETALEAADRVRSRPAGSTAGGTEGEGHEAGIEDVIERAVHALLPIVPVHGSWQRGYHISDQMGRGPFYATPEEWVDAANAVCELHAVLSHVPSPVSSTEPEAEVWRSMLGRIRVHGASGLWTGEDCAIGAVAALEGEAAGRAFMLEREAARDEVSGTEPEPPVKAGATAREILSGKARPLTHDTLVRGTEPVTAKLVEALRDPRLDGPLDRAANAYLRERESAGTAGGAARRIVTAFLAGFSVDAGKPEENEPPYEVGKFPKEAGLDGR